MAQEDELVKYLLRSSAMYFGLTNEENRALAYEYAIKLEVRMPASWRRKAMADEEWLNEFMRRHPNLALPKSPTLAGMTSFNRHNVRLFFDNLCRVWDRTPMGPDRIWNMGGAGIVAVHKSARVAGEGGRRQISHAALGTRGDLVTLTLAVSASGICLSKVSSSTQQPPMQEAQLTFLDA